MRANRRAQHIETSVEAFRGAIGDVLRAVTENASAMRATAQSMHQDGIAIPMGTP